MRIALLSQAGESGRHLRDALAGSGTPIVYEAQAAELDRDALEKSGASVIVVNLDAEVEAHLDEVYSLLDDERYNVIFNEAQVSSQLSGWEQARWARHLAAKILGTKNADPPRPAGAEPVPQRTPPAQPAGTIDQEQEPELAAVESVSAEPKSADDTAQADSPAVQDDAPVAEEDYSDIARLLNEVDEDSAESIEVRDERADADVAASHETVQMPELDLSEFDIDDETDPVGKVEVEDVAVDESDRSARSTEDQGVATLQMPSLDIDSEGDGDVLGFGDLDDFAGGIDEPAEPVETDSAPDALESELARSSADNDAAAIGNEVSGIEMLDLDWADAPAPPAAQDSTDQLEDAPPPEIGSAFAWSLEDIDDGEEESASSKAPEAPRDFGIEKISASEYLAPESEGEVSDEPDSDDLSLELIPLDEAVAHTASGKSPEESEGRESWLDTGTKVAVSRVWVLGASIGGPEAVREFLAELPAKCPALFLLAQHMGAEFMEIMAQQLARSTTLTVRTPTHGERVGHGDIVVVPTTHRLRVDREGVVTLEALGNTNLPNTPSIDQVLQDVADRFGSKAGFIVFSGMAEDAAEGSRYLAGIGGKVFAQDPETCVISSMVDGVIETGVVSFTGSPKALAGKLIGELKS